MAINSFTTLKTAVADWLDRDDIGDGISNMIALCESRLYSEIRVRSMESALSETIASGTITLPSDFLEFKTLYTGTSPIYPLELQSADWLLRHYPTRASSGRPVYASVDAGTVIFGPYPDSAYTVSGTYYARPTALSTSNETNFLTSTWPDVLLYGTLVHSALYLGQDARLPMWETAYQQCKDRLIATDKGERFSSRMPLRSVAG